jgi:hypothetical protein
MAARRAELDKRVWFKARLFAEWKEYRQRHDRAQIVRKHRPRTERPALGAYDPAGSPSPPAVRDWRFRRSRFRASVAAHDRLPPGSLTVCHVCALSDLDNISVRIADVAACLAVLGNRLRDELRSSTFP